MQLRPKTVWYLHYAAYLKYTYMFSGFTWPSNSNYIIYGYFTGIVQTYDWPIANEATMKNLGDQATLIHW